MSTSKRKAEEKADETLRAYKERRLTGDPELDVFLENQPPPSSSDSTTSYTPEMDVDGAAAGGAGGSSGDMPPTSLNNPYSGHIVMYIPDSMNAPVDVHYEQVWEAMKLQHPIVSKVDSAPGVPANIQFTVTKVEFYGASAGIISMTPYIQRPQAVLTYAAGDIKMLPIGQQMIDVGTITRKPMLSHSFGDSINNTRYPQVTPVDPTNVAFDPLINYQYIQKSTTPQPIDVGYLRWTFILRQTIIQDLALAIPIAPQPPPLKTYEQARKRSHEHTIMAKCDKIKRMTLPTLDSS